MLIYNFLYFSGFMKFEALSEISTLMLNKTSSSFAIIQMKSNINTSQHIRRAYVIKNEGFDNVFFYEIGNNDYITDGLAY